MGGKQKGKCKYIALNLKNDNYIHLFIFFIVCFCVCAYTLVCICGHAYHRTLVDIRGQLERADSLL